VEFQTRQHLKSHPASGMTGHGTYNQLTGTWSDDSSMALCMLVSLIEKSYDLLDMMERFDQWIVHGYMTPHGKTFDWGKTTHAAIARYHSGERNPAKWGIDQPDSNGNGSLMRILPISLYFHSKSEEDVIKKSFEISALTHAHIRSKLCCAYYSLLIKSILQGNALRDAMPYAAKNLLPFVPDSEISQLARILDGSVIDAPENKIQSEGYVVYCLESALWACSRTGNYRDAVLAVVNLGSDTDTNAAVAGGLAGCLYGVKSIPEDWLGTLAKKDEVFAMAESFAKLLTKE
jgi:ADP-ribosyl-[dinitrogen reductase] hydrolase